MLNKSLVVSAAAVLLSSFGADYAQAKQLYDHVSSDVAVYGKLNFEKQVSKNRDKGISIVHYYKDEEQSKDIKGSYEKFASDNKGIFRIGSVNCDAEGPICAKEKIEITPTIRIYPTFPAPTFDLDLSGDNFDTKKLKQQAGRFYSDKSIEITANNHKTFVEEDVATPKVLLFTNSKKGTPFVYKALSQNFEKTLQFGLIRESEDALAQKYKVKKFPSLIVIKPDGKPVKYEEADFSYSLIFEFLNVHSQIFVDPNSKDNTPKQSSAAKPWLIVPVPKMTQDSGNDICLKKDGALCIILLVKNEASLDNKQLDELNAVGQGFASKISRGISFYFMWLDVSTEPEFASVFNLEIDSSKVVILNPGKRKRFLVHEGEINEKAIEGTLDKILGGDARFKVIKGNKMPELVSLYETPEQKEL